MSGHQKSPRNERNRKLFPIVTQILSVVLGLSAFVLSCVTNSGCNFVKISMNAFKGIDFDEFQYSYEYDSNYGIDSVTISAGLFKYSECFGELCSSNKCVKYGNLAEEYFQLGVSHRASQAMGTITAAFGGLAFIASLFMLFLNFAVYLFKAIGVFYCFCFVTQMLSFIIFNNEWCNGEISGMIDEEIKLADVITCGVGEDAATAIVASIFYLALGILIIVSPAPNTAVIVCDPNSCCEGCCYSEEQSACDIDSASGDSLPSKAGNATVTERRNPDGTVTIREERVRPDGTSSVMVSTRPVASV